MSLYYDRQGKPIDALTWAERFEDRAYKQLAFDPLGDGTFVSTIWLGLDHGFGERLLIFETMRAPTWDYCDRYSTEEEALQGHQRALLKLRTEVRLRPRRRLSRRRKRIAKRELHPYCPSRFVRVWQETQAIQSKVVGRGRRLEFKELAEVMKTWNPVGEFTKMIDSLRSKESARALGLRVVRTEGEK